MLSRDIKDFKKSKIKELEMKIAVPEIKKTTTHTDRLDSTESLPAVIAHVMLYYNCLLMDLHFTNFSSCRTGNCIFILNL